MGGNAPGTINGLAGPFAATANLVYYLTIDDAVVLLDPNSTLDERLISGFFLIPTPGKFAKPFLKHADDAGGSSNIVRKGSKNEGDLNKDQTVNNKSGSKSIPKLTRVCMSVLVQSTLQKKALLSEIEKLSSTSPPF